MVITSTETNTKPSSASSNNGVVFGVNASSPTSSSCSELSPRKGSVGKPVRRRSRASKKTPTTHLNADAADFRAVVQQFTGCHTAGGTFPGAHKGPINLSFGVQDDDVVFDDSICAGFGMGCADNNGVLLQQNRFRKERQRLKKVEERETMNEVDDHVLMSSLSTGSTVESTVSDAFTLDDLDLDNIPAFHDFIEDFSLMTEDWNHSSF